MQPFTNPYLFQPQPYPQMNYQIPTIPSVQQPMINAKMVDNIDSITANDVSMQGISVFPKNDLSEVYIKSWQPNGTIQTLRYFKMNDSDALKNANDKNIDQNDNVARNGDMECQNSILERLTAIENDLKTVLAKSNVKKGVKNESSTDD